MNELVKPDFVAVTKPDFATAFNDMGKRRGGRRKSRKVRGKNPLKRVKRKSRKSGGRRRKKRGTMPASLFKK